KIAARLWEDPFVAVARWEAVYGSRRAVVRDPISDGGPRRVDNRAQFTGLHQVPAAIGIAPNDHLANANCPDYQLACQVQALACQPNPVATLRILGVSMSSAPYVGAAEQRRRRRYSVLSALAAEQYAPLDAEHISVMRDIDANEPFMEQVPYEWFQHVDGKSRVLVLWLDEHAIAFEPKHLLANLEQLV